MEKALARPSVAVAPDAVRVWRGWRNPKLENETFFEKLGSIFIPGTVQIQAPVGLTAYLPSVLPKDKPASVPDEIAVVFYAYQDAYDEAKETVGGRAYSDLHALVFDLERSTSGFPVKFTGTLEPDMRYHLFDQHVDWQHGAASTFVGVRGARSEAAFLESIRSWLLSVQEEGDGGSGPDGAIVVAAADTVVYWEVWPAGGDGGTSRIGELSKIADEIYRQPIPAVPIEDRLWQFYTGVEVTGGESFNCQFQRTVKPVPRSES